MIVMTATAFAQEEYDEQTIAEVNDHFRTGAQLYYDGEYDAAIEQFESAHAKIPNAIFLYNISLAQAKKGEHEKSLETAERADQFGGLGEAERQQNQARIAALRRVTTAQDASSSIAKRGPPVEPLFQFGTAAWIGTALVVGGLVGYGGVALIDRSIAADVDAYRTAAAAGDEERYEELKDDIRPRQTTGRVVFIVSSLAIVSGASLLVYDLLLHDRNAETTVSLIPVRGGFGVTLSRRF